METVTVHIPYGPGEATVRVPRRSLLSLPPMRCAPALDDVPAAVSRALRAPIGTPRLAALAHGRHDAVILLPDRTRETPVAAMLAPVLAELAEAGLPPERITLLIAVGTHRPMTPAEMAMHVGSAVYGRYRVLCHDHQDAAGLVRLGQTSGGIPIVANRLYHGADLKVALGSVKHHGLIGWGGGAKIVLPGVAGAESIGATHWRSAYSSARETFGRVETPLRHEIEEAAAAIGLEFILNGAPNTHGEMMGFFAGDFRQAFRSCVDLSLSANDFIFTIDPGARADILLAGTRGPDMWNGGASGTWLAEYLLRTRGGTIVQLAPCNEGVARQHPVVAEHGYLPLQEVEAMVQSGRITDLVGAAHMVHSGRVLQGMQAECILCSERLAPDAIRRLHLTPAPTPQAAVDMAFERQGAEAKVFAITESLV